MLSKKSTRSFLSNETKMCNSSRNCSVIAAKHLKHATAHFTSNQVLITANHLCHSFYHDLSVKTVSWQDINIRFTKCTLMCTNLGNVGRWDAKKEVKE